MPMGIGPGLSVTRGGSVTGIGAIGADLALWFDENQAYKSSGGGVVTPDSILTYTAPSPKLVYGSDGVLRYAPHNLYLYSQQFDTAAYTKTSATVTADAIAAPDGTLTGDTLNASVGTGVRPIAAPVAQPSTSTGQPYTTSIYAKAGTHSFIQVYLNNQGSDWANFNLTTGVVGTTGGAVTASIENAGNGWYRCIFTWIAGSTDRYPFWFMSSSASATRALAWNPVGTETVHLWGLQMAIGSSALTYTPTTTAAVYSLPRDHNPTTGAELGVLVEEARTNLLLRSQTFSNAYWDKVRGSITDNDVVAPDGTTTGAKFLETTDNNTHYVGVSGAGTTVSNGVAYTYSAYLKTLGRQWVSLNVFDTANRTTYFDIVNGVVGTTAAGTTASIQNVGNGWFRCIITLTVAATAVYGAVISASANGTNSFTGDITKGFYVWGAQLE